MEAALLMGKLLADINATLNSNNDYTKHKFYKYDGNEIGYLFCYSAQY